MALTTGDQLSLLLTATNFAAVKHKDQKRKDPEGTPYINHPIGVAHILAQVGHTPSNIKSSVGISFKQSGRRSAGYLGKQSDNNGR